MSSLLIGVRVSPELAAALDRAALPRESAPATLRRLASLALASLELPEPMPESAPAAPAAAPPQPSPAPAPAAAPSAPTEPDGASLALAAWLASDRS